MFKYLKKVIQKVNEHYSANSLKRKADKAYDLALKDVQMVAADLKNCYLEGSDAFYANAVGAIKDADSAAKKGDLEESLTLLDIAEHDISLGKSFLDDSASFSKFARQLK